MKMKTKENRNFLSSENQENCCGKTFTYQDSNVINCLENPISLLHSLFHFMMNQNSRCGGCGTCCYS